MTANLTSKWIIRFTCIFSLAVMLTATDVSGQAPTEPRLRALAEAALRAEGRTLMSGDLASALQGMPEADDIRGAMERPAATAKARNAANSQSGIKVVRTSERIVSGTPKISGGTATLEAEVLLERYMSPGPGRPEKWIESGKYRFYFEQPNGGNWRLVRYEEADPFQLDHTDQIPGGPRLERVRDPSSNTNREERRGRPKERPGQPPTGVKASNPSNQIALASYRQAQITSYNMDAARSYARIWACPAGSTCYPKGHTAYRNFEYTGTRGGDCTNFVSQALRAGGWPDVGGYLDRTSTSAWWYEAGTTQTYTWVGAHYFYRFLASNGRAASAANVWDLWPGEVLQLDFEGDGEIDHTMMVSWRYEDPVQIFLSYHTTNTLDRPLSDFLAYINSTYPNRRYYAWFIY